MWWSHIYDRSAIGATPTGLTSPPFWIKTPLTGHEPLLDRAGLSCLDQRVPHPSSSMDKRDFLRTAGGAGLALLFGDRVWAEYAAMPPEHLAAREDFWDALRTKYRLTPDY